ncbi:unnamed protein product [Caenorhabditis bovis]|uniref:Chitin-binding type-2 domain-containing protein n=1 Tax=Caenorhabditis bovis TaxID=2654633 RepID=A0A8S1FE28_9PELO|nr:unnamed protein product [Caenorhabditis bovis]
MCPDNQYYYKKYEICLDETKSICKSGETKPDIFDNRQYYLCVNGRFVLRSCGRDRIYENRKCTWIGPTSTLPTTTKATTTIYNENCESGYSPDPYDCHFFRQCENGVWKSMQCAPGTIWNQAILACDHYSPSLCQKTEGSPPAPPPSPIEV